MAAPGEIEGVDLGERVHTTRGRQQRVQQLAPLPRHSMSIHVLNVYLHWGDLGG